MQKRLILALLLISILIIPTVALAETDTTYTYQLMVNAYIDKPTYQYSPSTIILTFNANHDISDISTYNYNGFVNLVNYLVAHDISCNVVFVTHYSNTSSSYVYNGEPFYVSDGVVYYLDSDNFYAIPNWSNMTYKGTVTLRSIPDTYNGYSRGYDVGSEYAELNYDLGYQDGFTSGVADSNEYTFRGLLASTFDVPVNTFVSFFNFDTEGSPIEVNFLPLVTTLLTLSLVIAIAKMFVK